MKIRGVVTRISSAVLKNYVPKTGRIIVAFGNGVMLGTRSVAPEIRYYYRSDLTCRTHGAPPMSLGPHYRKSSKCVGLSRQTPDSLDMV